MLLAVMDMVESEQISENEIYYSEPLLAAFTKRFEELRSESDRNNPHLPFFHLRTEGFWHHQINPGYRESYNQLATASSSGDINKYIRYSFLDDELFELIQNTVVRELLRSALSLNLEITTQIRGELLEVDGWDWLECEACVADYFAMLTKELQGAKYNKTEHRRGLLPMLNGRSNGSVEFKHQNISAVLVEMGFPYISGYKPAHNYQAQLREVVFAHLAAHQNVIDDVSASVEDIDGRYVSNWENVLDKELPERIAEILIPARKYIARKSNYAKQESLNRKLGESGEEFVIEFEKYRMRSAGREDLEKEIEWSSKEQGDGLGYDVRSFLIKDNVVMEKEHFIEVKTTNRGKYQPFFISQNEVSFSKDYSDQYSLFRVYDFKTKARLFELRGAVEKHVNLRAELYRASFNS
jgi:hypothetical protein